MAVPKPMLTEFGINYGLESCAQLPKKELRNETFWKGLQFLLARQSKDGTTFVCVSQNKIRRVEKYKLEGINVKK